MIFKKSNSPFYYTRFMIDGKRYVRSTREIKPRAAKNRAEEIKQEIKQSLKEAKESGLLPITWNAAVEHYLNQMKQRASLAQMMSQINKMNFINDDAYLHTIKHFHINRFIQSLKDRGLSNQSIRHNINMIKGIIREAHGFGYKTPHINWSHDVTTVVVDNLKTKTFSDEQLAQLLKSLDPYRVGKGIKPYDERTRDERIASHNAYDLAVFLMDTGLRVNEAKINWNQVDIERGVFIVSRQKKKTKQIDKIKMTQRVKEILERRSSYPGRYVFSNPSAHSRTIRKHINNLGFNADADTLSRLNTHSLRGYFSTTLLESGMSHVKVAKMLGHSTPELVSKRYAFIDQEEVADEVVELLEKRK